MVEGNYEYRFELVLLLVKYLTLYNWNIPQGLQIKSLTLSLFF